MALIKTCMDCLHYYACIPYAEDMGADYDWQIRWVKDCENFEDRTMYVKIVPCKACEHFNKEEHGCEIHGHDGYAYVYDDDFCSYGERRQT